MVNPVPTKAAIDEMKRPMLLTRKREVEINL
jgi:hypothetical protein